MRTKEQFLERLEQYGPTRWLYDDGAAIAWRSGTGGNLEIVQLEVNKKREGLGREIVRRMVHGLIAGVQGPLPYHSVYAFCLGSREDACAFYKNLGFTETLASLHPGGLYKDDCAHLYVIPWSKLKGTLA